MIEKRGIILQRGVDFQRKWKGGRVWTFGPIQICEKYDALSFCERCGRPLNARTSLMYSHMKQDAYKILDKLKNDVEFMELAKRKISGIEL